MRILAIIFLALILAASVTPAFAQEEEPAAPGEETTTDIAAVADEATEVAEDAIEEVDAEATADEAIEMAGELEEDAAENLLQK